MNDRYGGRADVVPWLAQATQWPLIALGYRSQFTTHSFTGDGSVATSTLADVIAAWRITRSPGLAKQICQRSPPAKDRPPKRCAPYDEWVDALSDAAADRVMRLVAQVVHLPAPEATRRLRAIWDRGPDPRVVSRVLDWLAAGWQRRTPSDDPWWGLVTKILSEGSPSEEDLDGLVPRLEHKRLPRRYVERIALLLDAIPRAPLRELRLSGPQQTTVDNWLRSHPLPPSPVPLGIERVQDSVWAQVVADPDPDEPRMVLADWFTDHRDPLGDFIRYQLRFTRLGRDPFFPLPWTVPYQWHPIGAPKMEWFGHTFCGLDVVYERGCPYAARVRKRGMDIRRLKGERGLGTLRQLVVDGAVAARELRLLLEDPALANLQQLHLNSMSPRLLHDLNTGIRRLIFDYRVPSMVDILNTVKGLDYIQQPWNPHVSKIAQAPTVGFVVPRDRYRLSPSALDQTLRSVSQAVRYVLMLEQSHPAVGLLFRRTEEGWRVQPGAPGLVGSLDMWLRMASHLELERPINPPGYSIRDEGFNQWEDLISGLHEFPLAPVFWGSPGSLRKVDLKRLPAVPEWVLEGFHRNARVPLKLSQVECVRIGSLNQGFVRLRRGFHRAFRHAQVGGRSAGAVFRALSYLKWFPRVETIQLEHDESWLVEGIQRWLGDRNINIHPPW